MQIDKTAAHFPIKESVNFLSFCSISPLYPPAAQRAIEFMQRQTQIGRGIIFEYVDDQNIGERFHRNFGSLMKTSPENISMTQCTAEGISMIANGYPFQPGDKVISYVNEYPSNHYPWRVQQQRGVELVLLDDTEIPQQDRPYTSSVGAEFARGWSFDQLESLIDDRTRIVALSHVQFTSGFAADLKRLGDLCRDRGVDLVIDAAQSLGCLPVYPEEFGIAAIASAGWKWLMGPVGTGVLYTSPGFREKINITMSGANHMVQDTEYLDHTWNPLTCGRKFEYSTVTYSALDGISVGVEELFLKYSPEEIREHNFAMQELALTTLDMDRYQPVVHPPESRSGILAIIPRNGDAKEISQQLESEGIVITPRDGYLRIAPHLCSTEEEIHAAVEGLNRIG